MSKEAVTPTDQVTLLVFKDNYRARTFQIPLTWVSRLGLLVGLGTIAIILTTFLSVRYYRISRNSNPSRVRDLEHELSDLRSSYHSIEGRLAQAEQAKTSPAVTPLTAPLLPQTAASPPSGVSTPVAAPVISVKTGLFSTLPLLRSGPMPEPSSIPIKLIQMSARWEGKNLKVKFSIQYTRGDGGNQQGRIIVLGRGSEALYGYPDGILASGQSDTLVNSEKGEFFSVSRFRAVEAEFGPAKSKDGIKEVEALIVGPNSQILLAERIVPEPSTARALAPPKGRHLPKVETVSPNEATSEDRAEKPESIPVTPDAPIPQPVPLKDPNATSQ